MVRKKIIGKFFLIAAFLFASVIIFRPLEGSENAKKISHIAADSSKKLLSHVRNIVRKNVCEIDGAMSLMENSKLLSDFNNDKSKHCYLSCLIHNKCQNGIAMGLMGLLKEFSDPFNNHCMEIEDQWANLMGIAISKDHTDNWNKNNSVLSNEIDPVYWCKSKCLSYFGNENAGICPQIIQQFRELVKKK